MEKNIKYVLDNLAWNVYCCWRACCWLQHCWATCTGTGVPDIYSAVKNFTPREVYDCGGSSLVAPINAHVTFGLVLRRLW